MSLTINNNLMAANVARNLTSAYGNMSVSIQKLSSGLRINSAADDAAGLAISELAKAKSATLQQAQKNVCDAISMVQVSDGGLTTVDVAISRLKELAQQAATGTYSSDQREMISFEMQNVVSEIERAQKDLEFNGISIFKENKSICIQSGEEGEENIVIELPKATGTSIGEYMPNGQKSYLKCILDGSSIGVPDVGSALASSTQSTLDDQTITIYSAADVRRIQLSAAIGNNTVDGLLAAIQNLNMDGIREVSAVTYAEFENFSKAELNGSEGDMVKFDYNIGGTSEPTNTESFLIGRTEAITRANLEAALDRIIETTNTHNSDIDLSRNAITLKSDLGKSISIGNFELIDNPGIALGNFGNTPVNPTGTPAYIPNSLISFDIDGIPVSFIHSGNPATDMNSLATATITALTGAGRYYDAQQYSTNLTYPSPHEQEHTYTLRTNPEDNTVIITKINLTSTEAVTPANNLIEISDLNNNQTHVNIQSFQNYAGEEITLTIEGVDVQFVAQGTGNQLQNAENLVNAIHTAGIPGIDAYRNGNTAVLTRTNSEQPIDITYDDEDNNVSFTNFSDDKGATVSFNVDGNTVNYTIGNDDSETATNLSTALLALPGYTVSLNATTVRLTKNNNTQIQISAFTDDGINEAQLGPFTNLIPGESVSFNYRKNGTNYPVSFIAGNDDNSTALNLFNSLSTLFPAPPNTNFTLTGSSVTVTNSDNVAFQLNSLVDGNGINTFYLAPFQNYSAGENVSLTLTRAGTNYNVSFTAQADDDSNASALSVAINSLSIPNISVSKIGNLVQINSGGNLPVAVSNLSSASASIISMDITPDSGSTAGGGPGVAESLTEGGAPITIATVNPAISMNVIPTAGSTAGSGSGVANTLTEGNSIAVTDINTSVQATPGAGSSASYSGVLGQPTGITSSTITDLHTELSALAGPGSTNSASAIIFKENGQSIGTTTSVTASRATATALSLENGTGFDNTPLGISGAMNFNFTEDNQFGAGEQDHVSSNRVNAGLRVVGLTSAGDVSGHIDSQHSGADPDEKWVTLTGTGEFILDPNISFMISSTIDGTSGSTESGAFNAKANEAVNLEWSSSGPISKAMIYKFNNVSGETISFSICGVNINFVAGASQSENSNNLLTALNANILGLTTAGISFERTANQNGVYLFNNAGEPIQIKDYNGDGVANSGFSIWNVDSPFTYEIDETNPSIMIQSWTPLSQLNYKTQEGASTSLSIVNSAINYVSQIRAILGGYQNALSSHSQFLDVESLSTASMISRIEDTDYAKEMTTLVSSQIIAQSATAMLAQANLIPKMVLQLIQE